MRRREFITLLGGAAATWPMAARGQQPAMPVIGVLTTRAPGEDAHLFAAFHRGLKELGYVEGQNVSIDYRFAGGQYDWLPALAAELVRRQVAVIISAGGLPAALAARAATTTIPVVFNTGADPVKAGLVVSLARPGGNVTGVSNLNTELAPKRLELLHELVPTATVIAFLVNPTNPLTETLTTELQAAARAFGMQLHVLHASSERDFDSTFETLRQLRGDALVIGADTFFNSKVKQLAVLTARHAVPSIFQGREFAAAGGLTSYGGSITERFYAMGLYTGRILKGEKPTDLPVQQTTKVELVINLKTAKALGITVPITLLGRADEVIE